MGQEISLDGKGDDGVLSHGAWYQTSKTFWKYICACHSGIAASCGFQLFRFHRERGINNNEKDLRKVHLSRIVV